MRIYADLHIHSKYSRACSTTLDIDNLEKYAKIKGINLLGTGDFTHPKWIQEIKSKLQEKEPGIYRTANEFPFILQTEVSLVYTQDNKGRKVHLIVLSPNLDVADQITEYLKSKGRVDYDGRPIFKIPCPEFVEAMNQIDWQIEVIPAHIWTPWFSLFGANSGFDRIEDCFQDKVRQIHALETGLSSDPAMNWRLSALDRFTLISNSDLHSYWPWRLGRECNVFDLQQLTYKDVLETIITRRGFVETLEFWPHEGKYHFDGHRACNVCLDPKETIKMKNICPVCKRPLTIGVAHRVEELADRELGFKPKDAIPFRSLIPLSELLAKSLGTTVATKKVWDEYYKILNKYPSEFAVLLEATKEDLEKITHPKIAEIIIKNRTDKIQFKPGYDGVYGEPEINPIDGDKKSRSSQKTNSTEKVQSVKKQKSLIDF